MPRADLARLLAGLDPWAAADVAARAHRLGLPVAVPPVDTDLASCWLADPGELVALPTGTEVLATLAHRPAWMRDAECRKPEHRGVDWHPRRGNQRAVQQALAICHGCQVRAECVAWATTVEPPGRQVGILGGLTARQRRAAR